MQSEELACLPVGSEVSAKYKGAFCEAKVKKVHRQVKCRITFKQGLGNYTLCDTLIKGNIATGANVQAKHPEKSGYLDAVINKIQDQSHYTVVFDDGDIATLRRNALCMKSGKHFNASESLDNLPLTHPEHFGTPVGSRRRGRVEEEEEPSSEDEESNQPYLGNIGRVVCVEVTDKKMMKARENWFPGLIVAPNAQEIVKINTKEDFLVRSFKDHRFYTVPKKECKKFHKDSVKSSSSEPAHVKAVENAIAFLDKDVLPVHWDREVLFDMREETSTEGSSEEDLTESGDEDNESTEEKDHLVAELYKHMDDRGTPINRTPCIGQSDVDLYKLFKIVQRLGGQNRVTANNQWRQVAKRLGFETNWCVNQVRVCYNRYLHSFEEMYRTLGCTFVNYPKSGNHRIRHGSGRPLVRGARVKSRDQDDKGEDDVRETRGGGAAGSGKGEESSDQSSTTSQDEAKQGEGSDTLGAITRSERSGRGRKKGWRKIPVEVEKDDDADVEENQIDQETEIVERTKPGRKSAGSSQASSSGGSMVKSSGSAQAGTSVADRTKSSSGGAGPSSGVSSVRSGGAGTPSGSSGSAARSGSSSSAGSSAGGASSAVAGGSGKSGNSGNGIASSPSSSGNNGGGVKSGGAAASGSIAATSTSGVGGGKSAAGTSGGAAKAAASGHSMFSRSRRDSSSSLSAFPDTKVKKEPPEKGEKSSKRSNREESDEPAKSKKGSRGGEDPEEKPERKARGDRGVEETPERGKNKREETEKGKNGKGDEDSKGKSKDKEETAEKVKVVKEEEKEKEPEKKGKDKKDRGEAEKEKEKVEETEPKTKRGKEAREAKEAKEMKESKDVKETKDLKELKEVKETKEAVKEEEDSDSSIKPSRGRKKGRVKTTAVVADEEDENTSDMDAAAPSTKQKKHLKKKMMSRKETVKEESREETQHLKNNVVCNIGDKIKVFWLHGQIYEAKILKLTHPDGQKWPRFYVHYLGWNSRYDEWITRARIAHNETWNQGRGGGKSSSSSSTSSSSLATAAGDALTTAAASGSHQLAVAAASAAATAAGGKPALAQGKLLKSKGESSVKKEEDKSDTDKEEDTTVAESKTRDEKREELSLKKKRGGGKGKVSTPTSTPESSRTSSPASTRAARSPTKQVSPSKDLDDQEDKDDRSAPVTRTESPVTRKLKRQSSNASLSEKPEKSSKTVKAEKEKAAKGKEDDTTRAGKEDEKPERSANKSTKDEEKAKKKESEKEPDEILTYERRKPAGRNGKEDPVLAAKRRPNTPDKPESGGKLAEEKKEAKPADSNPRTSARLESKRPVTPGAEARRPVTPVTEAKRPVTPSRRTIKEEDPYDFKEIEESTLKFEPTVKLTTESGGRQQGPKSSSSKIGGEDSRPSSRLSSASASAESSKPGVAETGKSTGPGAASASSKAQDKADETSVDAKDVKTSAAPVTPELTTTAASSKSGNPRGRKKKGEDTPDDTHATTGNSNTPGKSVATNVKPEPVTPPTGKSKADAVTTTPVKSNTPVGKKSEQTNSPVVEVKKEEKVVTTKSPESSAGVKLTKSPIAAGQPTVALQRISTASVSLPMSSTTAPLPLVRPITAPNRFALFPHLASLSAGSGGLGRPLPTVAPPLPPSTIQPLPTMAPSLPPSAPPLPPPARFMINPPQPAAQSTPLRVGSPPKSTTGVGFTSTSPLSTSTTVTTSNSASRTSVTSVSSILTTSPTSSVSSAASSTSSSSISQLTSTSFVASMMSSTTTPLSTSCVIDAIVGNVLQSNLERSIKKEDERDVKPSLPLPSSARSSPVSAPRASPGAATSPRMPSSPVVKSPGAGQAVKQENIKTEVKKEESEDSDQVEKNNSETDDADDVATGGSGADKKDAPSRHNRKDKRLSSADNSSTALSPRKTRKRPKIRGPRKPNLKSREVVSDTDSDSSSSSDEVEGGVGVGAGKQRAIPPKRRKTIESNERRKAAAAAAAQQQDQLTAVAAKKADDSDADKSLVCRETIERSPERDNTTHKFSESPGNKSLDSSDLESLTGSPKRTGGGSDLESSSIMTATTRSGRAAAAAAGNSDVESVTGSSRRAGSVDSRGGMDSSSDTRSGGRGKRKRGGGASSATEISPTAAKKKRKSRGDGTVGGTGGGRGRGGKGRGGRVSGSNSNGGGGRGSGGLAAVGGNGQRMSGMFGDAAGGDDSEHGSSSVSMMGTRSRTDFEMTKLERLDNEELEALAQPKPNTNSKYNFYVKLDPSMDSGTRISALQGALEELRKTYLNIKGELSALERRRKKIRKKKEQRSNTTEISAPS